MTTQKKVSYVLDYETGEIRSHPGGDNQWISKYYYQVDTRGNVKIQEVGRYSHDRGATFGNKRIILSIDDNIPIPTYLVDMLKEVISCDVNNNTGFWHRNVINIFNKIKSGLKELANNPLDATDLKSQLDFSMNKNEKLQNELKEMEQKLKNIQAAYVDTLKDNEKIKQEKAEVNDKLKKEIEDLKVKNTKITEAFWKSSADVARLASEKLALELEKSTATRHHTIEIKPEFGDNFKTDYPHSHSLHDCYHNPGGATIYTKANAMNRMVFNPLLRIYEPVEDK